MGLYVFPCGKDEYEIYDTLDNSIEIISKEKFDKLSDIILFTNEEDFIFENLDTFFSKNTYLISNLDEFRVVHHDNTEELLLSKMLNPDYKLFSSKEYLTNKDNLTYFKVIEENNGGVSNIVLCFDTVVKQFVVNNSFTAFLYYLRNCKKIDFSCFYSEMPVPCNFRDFNRLRHLDLTGIKLQEDLSRTFEYCKKLQSIKFDKDYIIKPNDVSNMFKFCNELRELDLTSFDLSSVHNFFNFICECKRLKTVKFNKDKKYVLNYLHYMFYRSNIENLDMSMFYMNSENDYDDLIKGVSIFADCKIKYLDIRNIKLSFFELLRIKGLKELFVHKDTYKSIMEDRYRLESVMIQNKGMHLYCCDGDNILDEYILK